MIDEVAERTSLMVCIGIEVLLKIYMGWKMKKKKK